LNSSNISKNESIALYNLRNTKNIVIKAADKGGGIVILNKEDYVNKIITHLNDSAYLKVPEHTFYEDPLKSKYQTLIFELKPFLSNKQFNWLCHVNNEPGILYGLPKIHKKDTPIRPIISQSNCLTYKLHKYIQQLLKIGELQIPNLIKDTTDFLNKIKLYNDLIKPNTFLVTLDVESLYTNIPLDLGIEYIIEHYSNTLKFWEFFNIDIKPIPPTLLKKVLEFTLKSCYFTFNHNYYKQIHGLTMGGASSVQAANIVMFKFFQRFFETHPDCYWDNFRFIDDLFGLWNKTEIELHTFLHTLNSFHPNFKFTLNHSIIEIPFLDVKITKNNNKLQTSLYTKPTDKKLYLNFFSNHPPHTKKSIPFSQLLRLKRIISETSNLNFEINHMINNFRNRNYPECILREAVLRLTFIDRESLLIYKNKPKTDKLILILTYENKYDKNNILRRTFHKLWKEFISENPYLFNCFKTKPIIAFRNAKNIKKTVTSSKFPCPWHETPININALDQLNLSNLIALQQ
jgi:Reverse transcriptase (RNA-dependent DNA polymerase)